MVKEQITKETETMKRHPLAIAWDEWIATDEGNEACAASTLPHNTNHYLENRLHRAFDAGAEAAQTAGWQYTHERDAELIRQDGMMCEAHPGLEFGHAPECAGPGMAWLVEGRKQIESLASPSDTEQLMELRRVGTDTLRVLEMFKERHLLPQYLINAIANLRDALVGINPTPTVQGDI